MLTETPSVPVIPVTLQYSFGEEKKPSASILFGNQFSRDWTNLTRSNIALYLSAQLEAQADRHKGMMISGSKRETAEISRIS